MNTYIDDDVSLFVATIRIYRLGGYLNTTLLLCISPYISSNKPSCSSSAYIRPHPAVKLLDRKYIYSGFAMVIICVFLIHSVICLDNRLIYIIPFYVSIIYIYTGLIIRCNQVSYTTCAGH